MNDFNACAWEKKMFLKKYRNKMNDCCFDSVTGMWNYLLSSPLYNPYFELQAMPISLPYNTNRESKLG